MTCFQEQYFKSATPKDDRQECLWSHGGLCSGRACNLNSISFVAYSMNMSALNVSIS